jgi:lipopolysaccharide/colanic/teichoic acid biosynthesis glycosyltransferase
MGKNGVPFRLFKFRTMKSIQKAPEGRFNPGDRTRVTKLGSFLRKYKLDELPQLINVLIGDMSIVGPRPEIREWTEVYPSEWKIILSVKPGITDNASIAYRDEEEILSKADDPHEIYRNLILPRKLALYISYVQNNNLLKDIGIIFRTLITVIYK